MLYDPDNTNYIYDSRQFLTDDEAHVLMSDYRRRSVAHGFKQLSLKDMSLMQAASSILALVLFIGLIIGFIVALKMGHPAIGTILFASVFLIAGLMMAISGKESQNSPGSSALSTRTAGLMFAMMGLSAIIPMALMNRIGSAHAFIFLAAGLFTWAGLFFSADMVRRAFRARKTYGEPVTAQCTGYVRTVQSDSESGPWLCTHEIFEYEYNGMRYQAINPVCTGRDANMAVGEYVEVRIHPKKPDEPVYASDGRVTAGGSAAGILFASIFVIAGIGLLLFGIFGHINDADFEVKNRLAPNSSQSSLADGKTALTDEYIQSRIDGPAVNWEISLYEIADKYEDAEYGYLIELTDGSVRNASKEVWDSFEPGQSFYQIINADTGEYLKVYRCEQWEYTGTRPVKAGNTT